MCGRVSINKAENKFLEEKNYIPFTQLISWFHSIIKRFFKKLEKASNLNLYWKPSYISVLRPAKDYLIFSKLHNDFLYPVNHQTFDLRWMRTLHVPAPVRGAEVGRTDGWNVHALGSEPRYREANAKLPHRRMMRPTWVWMATPRAMEAENGTTGGAREVREGYMEEATWHWRMNRHLQDRQSSGLSRAEKTGNTRSRVWKSWCLQRTPCSWWRSPVTHGVESAPAILFSFHLIISFGSLTSQKPKKPVLSRTLAMCQALR